MAVIPSDYVDLLEGTHFATIATINPDGSPHQTVVWIDYDGEYLTINTAEGRQKVVNARNDPAVSVTVIDSEDPQRYLSVSGEVVEITEEGAVEHGNRLGLQYEDNENFADEFDAVRVIMKIRPESSFTHPN